MIPRLKICGITDVTQAQQLSLMGVDLLGLIFHPSSPRHIELTDASRFSSLSAKLVPVVVEQTLEEMQTILNVTGAMHIQCHGEVPKRAQITLPDEIQRIFVISFPECSKYTVQALIDEFRLDVSRDYLLLDSIQHCLNIPSLLERYHPFRCFIAGRLDATSCQRVLKACTPFGIDMASQVETAPGIKDCQHIQQVIASLHHPETNSGV